ncbi:MAG TPA: 50S ribosomal protein L17 [Planctomycetes bacterium]|nr:50S ribosomal protein L17 [Planctomycetota bacterium]
MRHKKRGRTLGRNSSHRRALLRNLASSLFLTEWDFEEEITAPYDDPPNHPGRITTTLQKAKEVRSLVEKCVTIALKSLPAEREAEEFASTADKGTDSSAWEAWRNSEQWQQWAAARAPAVNARRRVLRMLGNKKAVKALFEQVAPRFEDEGRTSGYTRVLRLAKPRLGDGGIRAILEFSGKNDRISETTAQPLVADDDLDDDQEVGAEESVEDVSDEETAAVTEDQATEEAAVEEKTAEEEAADDQAAEEEPPAVEEAASEEETQDNQDAAEDGEATETAPAEDSTEDDKE